MICLADVKFAEIKMENGKSQGWGLVRFGSADDAQNAICILFLLWPLKLLLHKTEIDIHCLSSM